ncbi:MAG: hypothetical protein AB7I27_11030 [Bacteriovoracaceae bacterium]
MLKAPVDNHLRETHPYGLFLPNRPKMMIIGSFPIAKFTNPLRKSEIKKNEIDFFFGGETNLLWRLLGDCFDENLSSKKNIKMFLNKYGIAIGDLIISARRKEGRSSDSSLFDIEWNTELEDVIQKHKIKKLYFTSIGVRKWFEKLFPNLNEIEKVNLISPSAQTGRSIGGQKKYKRWKLKHKNKNIYDFILEDYKKKFTF